MTISFKFKFTFALAILFFLASASYSQVSEKTPRLVVNIILKDFQTSQLTTFYDRLGDNGLKKIIKDGTYYPNAGFDHLATYEGGNLATIFTGAQPSVHFLLAGLQRLPSRFGHAATAARRNMAFRRGC